MRAGVELTKPTSSPAARMTTYHYLLPTYYDLLRLTTYCYLLTRTTSSPAARMTALPCTSADLKATWKGEVGE